MSRFNRLEKLINELTQVQTELQEFFDLTPDLLAILQPDGMFQILSSNWEQTLGWPTAVLESSCWTEFLHPDDRGASDSCLSLLHQTDGSQGITLENRFRCRDGSYRWLSWRILRCGEGQITAVVKTINVIEKKCEKAELIQLLSHEKTARIEAETNEQRFRELVNSLSDAIVWECDPETLRFTFVSQSAERILGFPVEHWQSKQNFWVNLIHPHDRSWVANFCREEVEQGRDHEFEYRCTALDGRTIWLRDRVSLVRDSQGRLQRLRGLMVDITERKQIEVERVRLLEDEQAANQAKDEFLATVSHELRSPLTNIKMAIQMLKIATRPQQREDYMQILQAECNREIDLVNNLLDLQRLEAGATSVEWTPLQLQSWLTPIVEPFMKRAIARQQILQLDLSPDLPTLMSDLTYLERIVAELLNNACKYTPPGGEIAVVAYTITSTTQPNRCTAVELIVSNSGVEIPATELNRVFEKFYRVPSADPWKQGGTGLGLALIAKLVQLLGGEIRAESQMNMVKFILTLPI